MKTDESRGTAPILDIAQPSPLQESAGRHLVTRVPTAGPGELVEELLNRLRGQAFDATDVIYIVDEGRSLLGSVAMQRLLGAPAKQPLSELLAHDCPRVGLQVDQEHVAAEAISHRATSVAVVDDRGRFVGAVPALSLLEILRREHVEDLHRLAGIARETAEMQGALQDPPLRRARHRLPWLLVGLVGSMLAAAVMARFEHVLEGDLAVAFFVPAIVYLADAIGTQTEAIVVRGLSLSRLSLGRLLLGELRTGALIGMVLGAAAFPAVALGFANVSLAIAVSVSIALAGGVATTIGLLLPWIFQRAGKDPAFGSGPVATIIQDVLSILIYFSIVSLMRS